MQIVLQKVDLPNTVEDKITTLVQSGVLETKRGQVILHFDQHGNLRKIERNEIVFNL